MGDFFYGVKSVVNRKTAFLELEVNERLHLSGKIEDEEGHQGIERQPRSLMRKDAVTVDLQHMLSLALEPLNQQEPCTPQQHASHLHRQAVVIEQR